MISETQFLLRLNVLRQCAPLVLCAGLLPMAACKKEEAAATAAPAAAAPAAVAAPEPPKELPPVEFKAMWPVGQRIVQRIETTKDTEGQNPVNQQPYKQVNTLVQEIAFTALKERDGGGYEVEAETLAITTTNKIGTNTVVFTSRSDPKLDARNNPLAAPMRKLVGAKVKYSVAADGKVEKVEGGIQLRSKAAAGASPYAIAIIASTLSDEAIKGWNTLHTGLPEKAMKPGGTWSATRSQNFGTGSLSVDFTNTFKGWEQREGRKVALIESTGTIIAKPAAVASTVTITVDDGAKMTGNAWFDPALGMVVEFVANSEFNEKRAMANGQGTSSKVKVTVNSRLTDAPNPGAAAAGDTPAAPAAEAKPAAPKAVKAKTAEKP